MDFLIDFSKLFGRKIISIFVWFYIYCFLVSLDSNFFICSYLSFQLSDIENNILLVILFFCFFVFISYNRLIKSDKIKINNYINFKYMFLLFREQSIVYLVKLFLSNVSINLINILNLYKNNFLIVTFLKISLYVKNNSLLWYPIYKSYSIFGYYKSTRLKYIDLKNENLKRLKY